MPITLHLSIHKSKFKYSFMCSHNVFLLILKHRACVSKPRFVQPTFHCSAVCMKHLLSTLLGQYDLLVHRDLTKTFYIFLSWSGFDMSIFIQDAMSLKSPQLKEIYNIKLILFYVFIKTWFHQILGFSFKGQCFPRFLLQYLCKESLSWIERFDDFKIWKTTGFGTSFDLPVT